jgi:hypothetical protein
VTLGAAQQRPVNAADLESGRPASLFHFIPRRSSDRRRPPVIHLSRLPRVRSSSAVRSLDSFPVPTKAPQRTALTNASPSRAQQRRLSARDVTDSNNSLTIPV